MPRKLSAVLAGAGALLAGVSFARAEEPEFRLHGQFSAVPVAISGTLQPWVVTLDGQEIQKIPRDFARVTVDGSPTAQTDEPHAPFFFTTDRTEFVITPEAAEAAALPAPSGLRIRLPELHGLEVEGFGLDTRVRFAISNDTASAKWNGEAIALTDTDDRRRAEIRPDPDRSGLLELQSGAEPPVTRIYNVSWRKDALEPERDRYIAIRHGDQDGGGGWGLAYGQKVRGRYRIGGYATYASTTYLDPSGVGTSGNSSWMIAVRAGWLPFVASLATFDLKRLELGVVVAWESITYTWTSSFGSGSNQHENAFGGFYFREEFLRFGRVGFAVGLQFFAIHAMDHRNMRGGMELGYHFP